MWSSSSFGGLQGAYRVAVAPPDAGDTAANPRVKVATNWGLVEWANVTGTWTWLTAVNPHM
jgi:hypothetical protein